MHSYLRLPDAAPVIHHFYYDAHITVQLGQLIRSCVIVFTADTLHLAVTVTFDAMTLDTFGVLAVMNTNFLPNLSKIEQSTAELLRFQYLT